MSVQTGREKYDRLKQKAVRWQNLALDYKDRIEELQNDLNKRLEDDKDDKNNYKEIIVNLTDQIEKWKEKVESAENNLADYNKVKEELRELKSTYKNNINDLENKHMDQLRELKYETREKIADLKSEIRLKDGEIQTEKRALQDTINYWKKLYEEERRRS